MTTPFPASAGSRREASPHAILPLALRCQAAAEGGIAPAPIEGEAPSGLSALIARWREREAHTIELTEPVRTASCGALLLHGRIANAGDTTMMFGRHALMIGARIRALAQADWAGEARAVPARAELAPGDSAAFTLRLARPAAAASDIMIELSLLSEGTFWYADCGFAQVRFAMDGSPETGEAASGTDREPLAVKPPEPQPFDRIYAQKLWGDGSGPGSSPEFTIEYRAFVERFIRQNRVTSIVDIGCGDWQFSRFMDFAGARYVGFDVVAPLIARNRARFGRDGVSFETMPPRLADLPAGDLLLVKDVLQHLPDTQILDFVRQLLPRYRFALLTNSFDKIDTPRNIDIGVGDFRCLDLTAPPYDVRGAYIFEYWGQPWERIRTLLVQSSAASRTAER